MTKLKKIKLKKYSSLDDKYFAKRQLLSKSLNLSKKELGEVFSGKEKYKIVTGFGLTGYFHLGSKLLLNEVKFFADLGLEAQILLSGYDTRVRGTTNSKSPVHIQKSMLQIIDKLDKNEKIKVEERSPGVDSEIFQSINDLVNKDDFVEFYGQEMGKSGRDALVDMAASIIEIDNQKKIVILLGVDELGEALFISHVYKKLEMSPPGFLFNHVVLGYDSNKMGKSRPEFSLVISSSAEEEIKKVEKYLRKDGDHRKCPCYYINLFSKYGDPEISTCKRVHKKLPTIIKKECKEFVSSD